MSLRVGFFVNSNVYTACCRSPWSNQYDPPLDDGAAPSEGLRKLEIEANSAFDQYREMLVTVIVFMKIQFHVCVHIVIVIECSLEYDFNFCCLPVFCHSHNVSFKSTV